MLHSAIQSITLVFITVSFILQILVLLGNFPGLHSVNIARVHVNGVLGSTSIFSKRFFSSVPDYVTIAVLRLCQVYEKDPSKNICTPASLGFNYRSSDELFDTFATQLPSSFHRDFAGIQGGIFIVSVLLCFILLVYYAYHQHIERTRRVGCFPVVLSLLLTLLAMIFAAATFAIQIYIHNLLAKALGNLKNSFLGSVFSQFVNIDVNYGASIWMSLVAFIFMFLTFVLLCFSMCCINRKKNWSKETDNSGYNMRSTQ
ncbi:hypothetical protein BY458DRAFT_1791 [Sporodiniella umbellata]|nr:hypothetical protein BY458DRAFT_1791 [Sporodiniella umbellata]